MTGIYKTPRVLHIQECDDYGNRRTVRYYREDLVDDFVMTISCMLKDMQAEADAMEKHEVK